MKHTPPKHTPPATEISVEILSAESLSLDTHALVALINANHATAQQDADRARALGESAVRHAIVAGLQLMALRQQTPHGQWEGLFPSGRKRLKSENGNHVSHLAFDSSTACRYIAVATKLVTKKLEPEQSRALMALAAGAEIVPESAALLEEITPLKTLRQVYLELGIVKPTPREAAAIMERAAAAEGSTDTPAAPGAIKQLSSAVDAARCDWFGTVTAGSYKPGSPVGLMELELEQPARGSLRLLTRADLETLAEMFRRLARQAAELAKQK